MIITSIFEQMFFCFESAMGFHCNRKTGKQMPKKYQLWVFNSKDSVEKMSE